MIDVYRRGRSGNLLETTGPVLCVEFGETVVRAIFNGLPLTYRYMGLKRGYLPGFAPEDKFHIVPASLQKVAMGLMRHVGISTDPGGDIFLELSEEVGKGIQFQERRFDDKVPTFSIEEISDCPDGLLDRGIDTLILPSLIAIERERISRTQWRLSSVDPDWPGNRF